MGKRSRKRGGSAGEDVSPTGTSRADRDAARRKRAEAVSSRSRSRQTAAGSARRPSRRRTRPTIDERPPAPWGSFPLVEIATLLAIVLFVSGLVVGGAKGRVMLTGGLGLGSLAGLELSIREHFAGYRSHTTLLAAACAFAAMAATFFATGQGNLARALLLPVAGVVFMATWWVLRETFKRRSGGLGFR
ncbi:MAG: hypothetical protein QOE06_1258 [Thermoleophilaceae bacterium]|jgi:hypothetical protein|nr:hypothetical protein [Thermoleophilaceae bacterium]